MKNRVYNFLFMFMLISSIGYTNQQDTIPPTFSWISPTMFSVLMTNTIRLSIEANDNPNGSGIKNAVFYAKYHSDNGFETEKFKIGEDDTAPYECLWDCSDIPDQYFQKLTFYCTVTDNAGNSTGKAENVDGIYDFALSVVLDRNKKLNNSRIVSNYTDKKLVIDGILDEWAQQDSIVFTNNDNRIIASSFWDDSNLYFGIRVYDRSFISHTGPESNDIVDMFQEDIIEIFFDTNHDHHVIYSSPDKSLKITPAGKIILTEIKIEKKVNVKIDSSVRYSCKQIIDGTINNEHDNDYCWTMELSIPLEKLFENPHDISGMGIEIWNNDKDYNEGTWFYAGWTTNSTYLLNPSEWGDLIFTGGNEFHYKALLIACMTILCGTGVIIIGNRLRHRRSDENKKSGYSHYRKRYHYKSEIIY